MTQPEDDIEQAVALLRRTLQQRVTPEVRARHLGSVERRAGQMRLEQRRNLRAARRPRVALLAALVGAMLLGTSSVALAASGEATPGELLYPVKRGAEEVRLIVATPFSAQGGVQLEIAAERVHEAYAVAATYPAKVVPLIAEAKEAITAAQAVGEPQVAEVAEQLQREVDAIAVAIADVAPEVAAVWPSGGLSDELTLTTETNTSIATLADDPSRAGAEGPSSVAPDGVKTDPATGLPILGTGIAADTSTALASPSPTATPTPFDD